MDVGDSFFVPAELGRSVHETAHIINAAAKSALKRWKWRRRFATRVDVERGGVRCWRIEDAEETKGEP